MDNYLTQKEKEKICQIKERIIKANSVKEVELLKEQIGLILERIIIRKQFEINNKKKSPTS